MTIHVAICDDDPAVSRHLLSLITQWGQTQSRPISATLFPSAEAFLFHYAENKQHHILLLDIEMGAMNGVELAKALRKENKELQIIFITGYSEYISQGYDVEALHYLLKPVDERKLLSVLDRAVNRLTKNQQALYIEIRGEMLRLPFDVIQYITVNQNYVSIFTHKETYTLKKPMREIEKALDDGFFRINRSCIISLKAIQKVGKKEVTLKSGLSLPLSRGLYQSLNQAFIRHF